MTRAGTEDGAGALSYKRFIDAFFDGQILDVRIADLNQRINTLLLRQALRENP